MGGVMRFRVRKIVTPLGRLILLLVLIPMLELFLWLFFFSPWITLLCMLISGLFGVIVAYRQGSHYWIELNRCLDRGETPTLPALHGILILSAMFLMIVPGVLTSLFGLLLLFPITRSFIVSYLVLRFEAQRLHTRKSNAPDSPEIIDIN
jgi:UPF0716 protein FxsA